MLISRRRLYWGTIFCMALCVCVLVRPMRSWLDGLVVSAMISAGIQVGEVHIHAADCVIETRELAWTDSGPERQYGLRADKAWFAIDALALIDRRWDVETVVVDDATLFLSDRDVPAVPTKNLWRDELAKRVAHLDWTDLRQHFKSLLAADGIAQRWDARIADWLAKSQDIVKQSQQISAEAFSPDNPLRHEDDVRDRLSKIEQLRSEQQVLMEQFDGVRKLLNAESLRLEQLFTIDSTWLSSHCVALSNQNQQALDAEQLAQDILADSGQAVWLNYAAYAEILARISNGPPKSDFPGLSQNYRNLSEPVVALNNVKASGNFLYEQRQTPFTLTGNYQQRSMPQLSEAYSWNCTFHTRPCLVQVELKHADTPPILKIRCGSATPEGFEPNYLTGEIQFQALQLSGGFSVFQPMVESLSNVEGMNVLAEAMQRNDPSQSLDYKISGTWTQPIIQPVMADRSWLVDVLKRQLDAPLERSLQEANQRLEMEFQARLQQLQSAGQMATQQCSAITQDHQAQLVATRLQLQASLESLRSNDILKRSGQPIRR